LKDESISYIVLVALLQSLFILIDKLLTPPQRKKVTTFFEEKWYGEIDKVRTPMYRRIALTIGQSLLDFTSMSNWKKYLIVSLSITVTFYAISQVLNFGLEYLDPSSDWSEFLPKIFFSFWLWAFPFALVINVVIFYCSVKVTAHLLFYVGQGSWLDAIFIPLFDLTIAALFFWISVSLITLIPLVYGHNLSELGIEYRESFFEYYYSSLKTFESAIHNFGGGVYGSAFSAFMPTFLFYIIFIFLLFLSIIRIVRDKFFSQVALIGSYKDFGNMPFTIIGFFISGLLIFIEISVLLIDKVL